MSDIRQMKRLARRVGQAEVIERARAGAFDTFYTPETAYTPTYLGASTAGTTTYTTQEGYYYRIGDIIFAQLNLTWTNATGTGFVRLGGLPYAASRTIAFPAWVNNLTFANGSIQGLLQAGNALAQLYSPASNVANTELTMEVAGSIRALIIYPTNG